MTLSESLVTVLSFRTEPRGLLWPEWDRVAARWFSRWTAEALAPPAAAADEPARSWWLGRAARLRQAAALAVAQVAAEQGSEADRVATWVERAAGLPGDVEAVDEALMVQLADDFRRWLVIESLLPLPRGG